MGHLAISRDLASRWWWVAEKGKGLIPALILHDYFRSSSAWRVRIALNLKGVAAAHIAHHLRKGEQRAAAYLQINPQGLIPAIETADGAIMTQSLAICEFLDETIPEPPLLPREPLARALNRAFALAIACDIHPVQNLRVLERLRALGQAEAVVQSWARDVIEDGLQACVALLPRDAMKFCFGNVPTLADIVLVPQLANARRFGVSPIPERLSDIEKECEQLDAFRLAAPENQADAE